MQYEVSNRRAVLNTFFLCDLFFTTHCIYLTGKDVPTDTYELQPQ